MERRYRSLLPAALLAASLTLTGCAANVNPGPAPTDLESINLGANVEVGPVAVLNLLIVTRGAGEPARLLGTIANDTERPIVVTISDGDDRVEIALGASETVRLEDNTTLLSTADDAPGARTTLTIRAEDATIEILTPVRDGSLDQYAPFLPEEGNG